MASQNSDPCITHQWEHNLWRFAKSRPRFWGARLDPSTASRSGQRSSFDDSLWGARLNPIDCPSWETVRRARLDPLRSVPGSETEPPGFSGVETLESQTVKPLSGTVLPVGKGFGDFPLKPVATLCQDFAALEQHFAKGDYRHRPRLRTLRTRRSRSSLTCVLRALQSAFFLHLESREARLSSVAHHVRLPVGGSPSNDHCPLFCTDRSVPPSPFVAGSASAAFGTRIYT